jgi:hypothetical protein
MDKLKLEILGSLEAGPVGWRVLSKGRTAGWLRAFRQLVRQGFIVESVTDDGPVYARTGKAVPELQPVELGDALEDILAQFRTQSTTVE